MRCGRTSVELSDEEYAALKRAAQHYAAETGKQCRGADCQYQVFYQDVRSTAKFFALKFIDRLIELITSKAAIVWGLFTWICKDIIDSSVTIPITEIDVITTYIWGGVTFVFLLLDGLIPFVARGNLNVDAKFGASSSLSKTISN